MDGERTWETYTLVIALPRAVHSESRTRRTGGADAALLLSINTYETCPAKFKFQYEDRLPQARSPALSFGDSLHRALYLFHDRPVPVPPSLEELHELLDGDPGRRGLRRRVGGADCTATTAARSSPQYHRENAAEYRIPAALEFRFTIEVEGVALSGVIDRMDRIPGGGYEIIDYKTNRRLPPQARIDQDLQLSIYHLAAQEIWGIEPERLTLYYLLPGQRMTTTRTPADVDELRRTDRDRRRADRGREVRAAPEPAVRLVRVPGALPAVPPQYDQAQGDPAPRMTEIVDEWIALKRRDCEPRTGASTS